MNLTTDKILETLRDGLESRKIRTYRIGDPEDFARSELPMIYVQPLEERVTQLDNKTDQKDQDFEIGLIIDPAAEYGKSDKGKKEAVGERLLMEIADGRNEDGTPMTNTIAHQLRTNWTLSGVIFNQDHRVVWAVRETPAAYYKEIHFIITARATVTRI